MSSLTGPGWRGRRWGITRRQLLSVIVVPGLILLLLVFLIQGISTGSLTMLLVVVVAVFLGILNTTDWADWADWAGRPRRKAARHGAQAPLPTTRRRESRQRRR